MRKAKRIRFMATTAAALAVVAVPVATAGASSTSSSSKVTAKTGFNGTYTVLDHQTQSVAPGAPLSDFKGSMVFVAKCKGAACTSVGHNAKGSSVPMAIPASDTANPVTNASTFSTTDGIHWTLTGTYPDTGSAGHNCTQTIQLTASSAAVTALSGTEVDDCGAIASGLTNPEANWTLTLKSRATPTTKVKTKASTKVKG